MAKIVELNPWLDDKQANQKKDLKLFLTEAEVRSFSQFKNAPEEEVQNIIKTLHSLALVSYLAYCNEENRAVAKAA